ncbi:MAG: hypothetical protein ACUVTU_10200 [Desulfurispora sp.]|uniref:hypothetical protein n=1 Tax=Desulfurispora sp. TaxID=3014275 RepID=UPI00404A4D7E
MGIKKPTIQGGGMYREAVLFQSLTGINGRWHELNLISQTELPILSFNPLQGLTAVGTKNLHLSVYLLLLLFQSLTGINGRWHRDPRKPGMARAENAFCADPFKNFIPGPQHRLNFTTSIAPKSITTSFCGFARIPRENGHSFDPRNFHILSQTHFSNIFNIQL